MIETINRTQTVKLTRMLAKRIKTKKKSRPEEASSDGL